MKIWLPEEETLIVTLSADGKEVTVDNQVSMREKETTKRKGFSSEIRDWPVKE